MDSTKSIFDLISKISSVETQQGDDAALIYEELFSAVNEKLLPLVDESTYPQKIKLKKSLDSVLEYISMFLRYPFLLDRTAVGILNGKADISRRVLRQIQTGTGVISYMRQKDLPCVVYDCQPSNQIMASNHANHICQLSDSELVEITKLYKAEINIRDIVKSYAVSASLRYPLSNYILFPRYAKSHTDEYNQLANLCNAFFLLYENGINYRFLPDAIIKSCVPLYIVAADGDSDARKTTEYLAAQYPKRKIELITEAQAEMLFAEYNRASKNGLFYDSILAILLRLYAHQLSKISESDKIIEALNYDCVFSSNIRDTINELRTMESKRKMQESKIKGQFDQLIKDILDIAHRLEEALNLTLPLEIQESVSSKKPNFASEYMDICGQIVLLALQCNDLTRANQYINKISLMEAQTSYIYTLYYKEAAKENIPCDVLKRLKNDDSSDLLVIRAKIHFASKLQLDLSVQSSMQDSLAYQLAQNSKDGLSAEELFYSARFIERRNGATEAFQPYREAFEAGSVSAGEWLVDYYERNNDTYQLKLLADNLVPKAAYLYSLDRLENYKPAQGITYLRIAISLQYAPAIRRYADILYDEVVTKEYITQADKDNIKIALKLYGFIFQKNKSNSIAAKIGVLNYMTKAYGSAKAYLELGESEAEANYYLGCMYLYGNGVSKDEARAKSYLYKASINGFSKATPKLADLREKEQKRTAAQTTTNQHTQDTSSNRYNSDENYSNSREFVSSSDEGCFITSAVCQSEGKADDCEELSAFRRYRDEILMKTSDGQALVEEYYKIAPEIVKRINQEPDCKKTYRYLDEHFIQPGYLLLSEGKGDEAKELYMEGVLMLMRKYSVAPSGWMPSGDLHD